MAKTRKKKRRKISVPRLWQYVGLGVAVAVVSVMVWSAFQPITPPAVAENRPVVQPSDFASPEATFTPATPQTPEAMAALTAVRAAVADGTLVYIGAGDSTRDEAGPSPFYYEALRAKLPLPAENIVSLGMNGATLRYMLDSPEWLPGISAAVAGRTALVDLSALTNDVRLGGMGATVDEISVNGAAILQEAIDQIRALGVTVKLTVPAPYLAEGEWIRGVDPAVASEGVRAAFLAAAAANPDVILQDSQEELFGFTTDRPMDGDQLHPGPQAQAALAGIVAAMLT